MSDVWKKLAERDNRTDTEIIRDRVEILAAVFNRKINEQLILVFQDALRGYPKGALKRAFSKAETELEKFPTVKLMRTLCNGEMPSHAWQYTFTPSEDVDPEFGNTVRVLIDPDPTCSICREPKSIHPLRKCECYTPSGLGDDRVMFRPQDCPEGRTFLALLAEIARKKKIPALPMREPGEEG